MPFPPELLHILERVFSISEPIPLLDNFCIQESFLHKIDIGKEAIVFISSGLVIFKSDFLLFNHSLGELIGFFSKILKRLFWMLCFGGINTDQANILPVREEEGVTVNNSLHFVSLGSRIRNE